MKTTATGKPTDPFTPTTDSQHRNAQYQPTTQPPTPRVPHPLFVKVERNTVQLSMQPYYPAMHAFKGTHKAQTIHYLTELLKAATTHGTEKKIAQNYGRELLIGLLMSCAETPDLDINSAFTMHRIAGE